MSHMVNTNDRYCEKFWIAERICFVSLLAFCFRSSGSSSPALFPVFPASYLLCHLILPPFSRQPLSLLPSHLITPHLLLSSLLLFCLSCPPLCDLHSAFLHALGHCIVQGVQGCLRFVLNNIHKETDEVLFIHCPLLCSVKPCWHGEKLRWNISYMCFCDLMKLCRKDYFPCP